MLEPPVLPEPPRNGENGPKECDTCLHGDQRAIWADDDWILLPRAEPRAVPAMVTLNPRAHHDLSDLPVALAADLGPLLQRLERAVGDDVLPPLDQETWRRNLAMVAAGMAAGGGRDLT